MSKLERYISRKYFLFASGLGNHLVNKRNVLKTIWRKVSQAEMVKLLIPPGNFHPALNKIASMLLEQVFDWAIFFLEVNPIVDLIKSDTEKYTMKSAESKLKYLHKCLSVGIVRKWKLHLPLYSKCHPFRRSILNWVWRPCLWLHSFYGCPEKEASRAQ